jgi:hypothetical protein
MSPKSLERQFTFFFLAALRESPQQFLHERESSAIVEEMKGAARPMDELA